MTNTQKTPKSVTIGTEIWTASRIVSLLLANDKAVERAIMALYKRQTSLEQNVKETIDRNLQGFQKPDALFMSRLAVRMERTSQPEGKRLNEWELARCRKVGMKGRACIAKYRNQLLKVMAEKEGAVVAY